MCWQTARWILSVSVKFEVLAGDTAAHHIALYGCDGEPARNTDVWYVAMVMGTDAFIAEIIGCLSPGIKSQTIFIVFYMWQTAC